MIAFIIITIKISSHGRSRMVCFSPTGSFCCFIVIIKNFNVVKCNVEPRMAYSDE